MREHPGGRRLRAVDDKARRARRTNVVEERGRRHDRVVLEREGRHRDLIAGEPKQVLKLRAGGCHPLGVGGPAQVAEQRGRIEDVRRPALRPVGFDQSDEPDGLDVRKRRRCRVDEQHTFSAGPRCEGLILHPPTKRRDQVAGREHTIVVPPVRVRQRTERPEDGAAGSHVTFVAGVLRMRLAFVPRNERRQRLELGRGGRRSADRVQLCGDRDCG